MAFEALVKIRAKFQEKIGMMLKIKEPPQPDKAGKKTIIALPATKVVYGEGSSEMMWRLH